jgi:CDP-glucose 4,6-dehydratase
MGRRATKVEKVVIDLSFWLNRRVFVTGHTGFKGTWLSLMLARLNATTTGYAYAPPAGPNVFDAVGAHVDIHHTVGDVCDLTALTASMQKSQPEIIFHLAAQPLVKAGYVDPVETYRTNVMGTVNVLQAARLTPSVRSIVVVTTDKCYDNKNWVWGYRETDRLGGHDPYSNSKACAELVVSAFRDSYFSNAAHGAAKIALASARAGNVIGGGDFAADRIVPDAIRAFTTGRSLDVRNLDAVRPWQHVLDPLAGYLSLAEQLVKDPPAAIGAWNFGPAGGAERDVRSVVSALSAAWGDGATWAHDGSVHAHEAHLLRLDSSKAQSALGWTQRIDFDTMIEWTVDWHRAFNHELDMRAFTMAQIDRHLLSAVSSVRSAPQHTIPKKVRHAAG